MRRNFASLGFALLLSACDFVTGSGHIVTESKEVTAAFSKVSVEDAISAVVSEGPASVRVTTDDNLVGYVDVVVQDGELEIRVRDDANVSPTKGLEVQISTPALVAVSASGASHVVAQPPPGERFDVLASGASTVELKGIDASALTANGSGASIFTFEGEASSVELALSGASNASLGELQGVNATVNLSGASTAQVVATGSVTGSLSGSSTLKVSGGPAQRAVQVNDSSNVEYR